MTPPTWLTASALFVGEGSSDEPLAELVTNMFFRLRVSLGISSPDYSRLPERVRRDVRSKVDAGVRLRGEPPDVIAVHRDANGAGAQARRDEISTAVASLGLESVVVPLVPVRMTEAWLLLNEEAIRRVAGNPRGRSNLDLPGPGGAERIVDPKSHLQAQLLAAGDVTGRRRERLARKFDDSRRQLLERLDLDGEHTRLESWRCFQSDVSTAADELRLRRSL